MRQLCWTLAVFLVAPVRASSSDGGTPPGQWLYTQPGTGYGVKNVGLMVRDFQGNLIVLGRSRQLLNLQEGYDLSKVEAFHPEHWLLAKFGPDKRMAYVIKIGEDDPPRFSQLIADRRGNLYGVAWFDQSIRLFGVDPGDVQRFETKGRRDILVVQWSSDGRLASFRRHGGSGEELASGLALEPDGRLIIVGEFNGTLELQGLGHPFTFQREGQGYDFFLAELNQASLCVWARTMNGAQLTTPPAVATDREGNTFVTGGFELSLHFESDSGTSPLQSRGSRDCFLAKYDRLGQLAWAIQAGGPRNDYGSRLLLDDAGCCYVTGRYGPGARFGSGRSEVPLEAHGDADMFMACYSGAGDLLGALRVGGSGPTISGHWTVVFDELGNRYLVGPSFRKVEMWAALPGRPGATTRPPPGPALGGDNLQRTSRGSRFESIQRQSDGSIQILLETDAEATYVVEFSGNLIDWIPVSTNRIAGGGLLIEDPDSTEVPVRFFRVRRP